MLINLVDAYGSAYSVFSRQAQGNHCSDEVFDERPDWPPPQPVPKASNRSHLITIFSVLLVAGFAYLVQ